MRCPVCSSPSTAPAFTGSDLLFETTSKTFTLDSCSVCRCLFLDPMPSDNEIAGFYPQQYWWTGVKPGMLIRLEGIYRKIALRGHVSFIVKAAGNRAGLHLLDVGCGSGALLGRLKRRGFNATGVDFSAEAAEVAERENGVKVVVGSLQDAAFPDESFDIVTLFHVMEHVTNPRHVLAEVARILRPNGTVILQVPNVDSWQCKIFKAKWYGLDIPRHVIDYPKDAMVRLLIESKFVPRRIRHFNFRDNAPALVSSLFPALDPISRAVRQRKHKAKESALAAWVRDLIYFVLVVSACPVAILEAAAGRGATVMIEAEKAVRLCE
jgi:SAM-dependent methyltransferase